MATVRDRDEAALDMLVRSLGTIEETTRPALASFIVELRSLLDSDRALAYSIDVDADGFSLESGHTSGFPIAAAEVKALIAAGLRRTGGSPWALYDPRAPASSQRNRVVTLPPASALGGRRGTELFRVLRVAPPDRGPLIERMQHLEDRLLRRIRLNDMHVCRTIICDGDAMLAWLGAARPEAFTEREERLLARLVPALRRRLRMERQLAAAQLNASTLSVVLDAVAAEAFIIDGRARIHRANRTGRAAVEREGAALGDQLRRALVDRAGAGFDVMPIVARGLPPYYLAVRQPKVRDPGSRVAAAAVRWGLTARQAQILAFVARGQPNKQIAASFGCVERTVEAHLTRIMARAGVESRSALIARFWST